VTWLGQQRSCRKPELLQLVENGQKETGEAVLAWRLVAVAAF